MVTTVLVVDDLHVQRVLIEGIISKNPAFQVRLAANGQEALDAIETDVPDVVVTDLVMPEMDGLELVRVIRSRHPDLPVILMTAYGDESTAAEALEAGAASYVPKAQQAERLMTAVQRVTDYSAANRARMQLEQSMLEYNCRFALDNDRRLIHALVVQIQQAMAGMELGDTIQRIQVSEALEEALLNAMYHGNLELNSAELAEVRAELDDQVLDRLVEERLRDPRIAERRILVKAHLTQTQARFVIRDEGCGFKTDFVPHVAEGDQFATGHDRGMTLIHSMMDTVVFNKAGNELVMQKQMQPKASGEMAGIDGSPGNGN